MKKIWGLLLLFISFGFYSMAQQFVVTTPQHKNVVLEEFTGIHCGYCPDGHARAEALSTANPGRVVLINVHAGGYAVPSTGEPDFRTSYGEALDDQAQVSGYPAGTVNRHIFPDIDDTKTAMSRAAWSTAAAQIFPERSPVNVGFKSTFDSNTRILTVNVQLYYTQNSSQSVNFINVALLENHVVGYQADYANGTTNSYDHKHILRDLFTGQWGDSVITTTSGSFVNKVYSDTVPVDWNINNCDIAVFVTETKQEIYTGVQDVAVDGSNDGSTVPFIGVFEEPDVMVQNVKAATQAVFDASALSCLSGNSDFEFTFTSDAPSDWSAGFVVNGTTYSSTGTLSLDGDVSTDIEIVVTPGSTAAVGQFTLEMEAVGVSGGIRTMNVYVISGITDLVINNSSPWGTDDGTVAADFQTDFLNGLSYAGNSAYDAVGSDMFLLAGQDSALDGITNIYYNVGWSFPSFSDELVAIFEDILDHGGNVMISGQDIGWDNWDDNGYGTTTTKAFIVDYCKTSYVDDGDNTNSQILVTGEELYKNITTSSLTNVYGDDGSGNEFMYPDELSEEPFGVAVFKYDASKIAAVRSNLYEYKTFYLGVSLEMISDESVRKEIMKITHDWFHGLITTDVFDQKMSDLNVFPNPAVNYLILDHLTNASMVEVYDLNSRLMLKEQVQSMDEQMKLNIQTLDQGMYIYKITGPGDEVEFGKFQVIR